MKLFLSFPFQASEAHERDEELRKKIDILDIRTGKSEEEILTLLNQNKRIDTHIKIALKDVQQVQTEMIQFKERVETQLKDETEAIAQKWAQLKLSIKQTTDMCNDVQRQANVSTDEIGRQQSALMAHQEYLEGLNRRITKIE